jgi:hypothetical protein
VRPVSFHEGEMTDWSIWVLDHGLPELPDTVNVGESVPVARWPGVRFGAVVHVQWDWTEEHDEDELQSEIELFRRTAEGWEVASGGGGGGWFSPPLKRPPIPEDSAGLGHFQLAGSGDWQSCAAYGFAGARARFIEVIDSDGVTRHPLESPLGVFLVAAEADERAVARVLREDGRVLMEQVFSPESEW